LAEAGYGALPIYTSRIAYGRTLPDVGEVAASRAVFETAAEEAHAVADSGAEAWSLWYLASLSMRAGDLVRADALIAEQRELVEFAAQELPQNVFQHAPHRAHFDEQRAAIALLRGDSRAAREHAECALEHAPSLGRVCHAHVLETAAAVALAFARPTEAAVLFEFAENIRRDLGAPSAWFEGLQHDRVDSALDGTLDRTARETARERAAALPDDAAAVALALDTVRAL
jgi:hypothetical protein